MAVRGMQQHIDAAGVPRFRVKQVVHDGAVEGRAKRAVQREPADDGQQRGGKTREKARRAAAERRKAPGQQQAEGETCGKGAQGKCVVGAHEKADGAAEAQEKGGPQQRAPVRRQLFKRRIEDAQDQQKAEQGGQRGVLFREVPAAGDGTQEREVNELDGAFRRPQPAGDCGKDAQAAKEDERFLKEDGEGAVPAGERLRQPLDEEQQGSLVVENLRIRRIPAGERRAHGEVNGVVAAKRRSERRIEGIKDEREAAGRQSGKEEGQHPLLIHAARPLFRRRA